MILNSVWVKFLSQDEQERFVRNITLDGFWALYNDCFGNFISGAFFWSGSPEGFDYWYDISERNVKISYGVSYDIKKLVMV